jgi:hypothetical protein
MEVLRFAPILNYFVTVRTCCRGCLVVLVYLTTSVYIFAAHNNKVCSTKELK